MDPVRILHKHWTGYGWSYTSPDVPSMIGGEDSYAESVRQADSAVRLTQGSSSAQDVSRYTTGNAFAQIFSQFQTRIIWPA